MNQDKLREIICKWKFGQRAPDCKSCFSKPECDEVLAQISALDEIDEGKLIDCLEFWAYRQGNMLKLMDDDIKKIAKALKARKSEWLK